MTERSTNHGLIQVYCLLMFSVFRSRWKKYTVSFVSSIENLEILEHIFGKTLVLVFAVSAEMKMKNI